MMRIGFDARYLSHNIIGGVHNTIKALLPALIEAGLEHEFMIYADKKAPFELGQLPPNAHLRLLPWKNLVSSAWNDFTFGRKVENDRLDVMHFPANYGFGPVNCKSVITLHDEINVLPLAKIIRGSDHKPRTVAMMTYLHVCTTFTLRNASWIVAVSNYSRRQISHFSGFPIEKISVVYNAVGPDVTPVTDPVRLAEVRMRLGLPEHFLLADGLKNPNVLLRAWQRLPEDMKQSRKIVFFSRNPPISQKVQSAVANGDALLLVRPSRTDMIALFSMADIFVFPSWIEGFGIPLLEAMTCGTPVIASDRGAIPEVAGGAALLIDAEDHVSLAEDILKVLGEPVEAARLRNLGFQQAQKYSWFNSACQTLKIYENLVG